jgi:TonB family protein
MIAPMLRTVLAFLSVAAGPHAVYPELTFQQFIKRSVAPDYPSIDQGRGTTGVVVLEISFDSRLSIEDIKVLQAPSRTLARAAQKVLAHWQFAFPSEIPTGRPIITKLTFYFTKCDGRYAAYYAREAPVPLCRGASLAR